MFKVGDEVKWTKNASITFHIDYYPEVTTKDIVVEVHGDTCKLKNAKHVWNFVYLELVKRKPIKNLPSWW